MSKINEKVIISSNKISKFFDFLDNENFDHERIKELVGEDLQLKELTTCRIEIELELLKIEHKQHVSKFDINERVRRIEQM